MAEKDKVLQLALKCLNEHKAEDIAYLDVKDFTPFANYYVLATCGNPRHLQAMSEHVEEAFEKEGVEIVGKDGIADSGWMIIQGEDVVVHMFLSVNRREINLEGLMVDLSKKAEKANAKSASKKDK